MKEVFILTKILLKNSINKNLNNLNSKKSKSFTNSLVIALILYIAGVIGFLSYELINALKLVGQEYVFLSLCLVLSVGVTLIKTILSAFNVLYFSKDIEYLLPLPIKPIHIVMAKFNILLISEYLTNILSFVIPFLVYAYIMQVGAMFYIYSLITFIFLPVIPMLISTFIIVLIMRFTKFFKNKDILQYLTVLLTIVIVLGVQFINSSSNEMTSFMIANKLLEINGLADTVSKYFITIRQATIAITHFDSIDAIKNIIFFVLESILSYIIVAFVASKLYIKTAIASMSSGVKSKNVKLNKIAKRNVGLTYVKKECKILVRNPIFFLQCVLPSMIFPIMFSIPIYRTFVVMDQGNFTEAINNIALLLQDSMGMSLILLVINFLYMFNFISVTAISRDGESAIFTKYIPIALHKQCKYKAIPSIILNMIPLLYIVGLMLFIFKGMMLTTIFEIFIIGLVCNILISYIAIFIDLLKPKLYWDNEYSVVKQNMNMLFSAIFILVLIGIIFIVCAYCKNPHIATIILISLASIVLIIYEMFLRKFSRQIFRKVA